MSISYNGAEVLRKAGVENFSKFLKAQSQTEKRKHLEAAIDCFERAFKASSQLLTRLFMGGQPSPLPPIQKIPQKFV